MIDVKELRIGNIVFVDNEQYHPKLKGLPLRVASINQGNIAHSIAVEHTIQDPNKYYESYSQYAKFIEPIPLSEELLLKCGFENVKTFTIQNPLFISLGRERYLSVSCIGTPNELLCVYEKEQGSAPKDIIVIHNYDYDGKLYLHKIQNVYKGFTNEELQINL